MLSEKRLTCLRELVGLVLERKGRPTGMNSIVFLAGWFIVGSRGIDKGLVSVIEESPYFTAFAK